MSYTNYIQVSFLLPLVQPGNNDFKKIALQYIDIMNEVNLLLANNIMILFDHLINSLEIQERNLDFVFGMAQLLHNRTRGVTFDQQKLSKSSDLYIKFEAANSAEIARFAMSFDKMAEAKKLINLLKQFKTNSSSMGINDHNQH
ncbi:hypothetical protein M9Y10_009437 [Tritrichomonas musculus]|uniref:Uncharacterized protein n=1 Tax=Tritrichomonas musculus TaxID=1915356 RepID=A0ABR2INB1_9EUKA